MERIEGYRSFIATGVADVIGFDPGRAEGITGGRRVIELVEEAGVWFNAHAWSSAIVSAASLALSLTTPRVLVYELKAEESPMQHELVERPIAVSNGFVEPLDGPGLGIDVRESVVETQSDPHGTSSDQLRGRQTRVACCMPMALGRCPCARDAGPEAAEARFKYMEVMEPRLLMTTLSGARRSATSTPMVSLRTSSSQAMSSLRYSAARRRAW